MLQKRIIASKQLTVFNTSTYGGMFPLMYKVIVKAKTGF